MSTWTCGRLQHRSTAEFACRGQRFNGLNRNLFPHVLHTLTMALLWLRSASHVHSYQDAPLIQVSQPCDGELPTRLCYPRGTGAVQGKTHVWHDDGTADDKAQDHPMYQRDAADDVATFKDLPAGQPAQVQTPLEHWQPSLPSLWNRLLAALGCTGRFSILSSVVASSVHANDIYGTCLP